MSASVRTVERPPLTVDAAALARRRARRVTGRVAIVLCLIGFTAWTLAPIVWAIISSVLPQTALTATPPDLSLANVTLDNFQAVLAGDRSLVKGLVNSAIIALTTAAIALLLGSGAAYALSRRHVPGAGKILLVVLATQMFPAIVVIIPIFIVVSQLGLTDTHVALIVIYLSFVLPIVIWILKGFFDAVPIELERAAAVDGASILQTFRLVVLPVSLPALFATGVFAFIEAWNEFFFAVILTRINAKTAPIAIAEFSGQYTTLYGQMVAAAVLASIPVVVLAIIFRRYILEGFVEGAVKG